MPWFSGFRTILKAFPFQECLPLHDLTGKLQWNGLADVTA